MKIEPILLSVFIALTVIRVQAAEIQVITSSEKPIINIAIQKLADFIDIEVVSIDEYKNKSQQPR